MFWTQRPSASDEFFISSHANPRLRRLLAQQLRSSSQSGIEQLSWLFWLLRTRQPKRLLIDGRLEPAMALMTAAAVSLGRAGRIQHSAGPLPPDISSALTSAGLDWVWLHAPLPPQATERYDALVLVSPTEEMKQRLFEWTPHLSAGALIIGMDSNAGRNRSPAVYSELLSSEPGLESLILAPAATPLLTMIWRGH